MNKTAIKNFAVWARNKLIADITYKAGLIGVSEKGIAQPLSQSSKDLQFFDIGTKDYAQVAGSDIEQRNALVRAIQEKERTSDYKTAFKAVIEEVAYTWFNRLIAIRFMEVNEYLPSRIRVLSSENPAKNEPDFVTTPFDTDMEFTVAEQDRIMQLKDENKLDELFRMLFIKQCNKLHEILPELFEETNDYTELLLSISFTDSDGVVYHLVHDIDEDDFNIEKEGQVEIIGWMYQYYISEKHEEVIDPIHGKTIKKEDIPAATQLFTTEWVVRYMVDNSLGKYWIERNPNSILKSKLRYYFPEDECKTEIVRNSINPEELTFIDPCMGSGHILVYAYDVLMEIYRECGYTDRDAAKSILEYNLYGLDIDKRAYQLAYFSLMMKAREYNRRILSANIVPNVCAIEESNGIDRFYNEAITTDKKQNLIGEYLIDIYRHAKEIGSLQSIEKKDYRAFKEYLDACELNGQVDIFSYGWSQTVLPVMKCLCKQAEIMAKSYDIVCTNPPYMNKMDGKLKDFVVDRYKPYSGDLFSVFMYRNFAYCKPDGYSAFMTPNSWMFLKLYEPLRKYIIDNKNILSLVQMAKGAFFKEATVDICSFVLENRNSGRDGLYLRLDDFKGDMDYQNEKVLEALNSDECPYLYTSNTNSFTNIPGMPTAYWLPEIALNAFNTGRIAEYAETKQGFKTGNNDYFLRFWFENDKNKVYWGDDKSGKKWFPCNKGGEYRKWYGNNDHTVNWENDGYELINYRDTNGKQLSRPQNISYNFREALTWSTLSSGPISFRYSSKNMMFESKGSECFAKERKTDVYTLAGFLNSKVCMYYLKVLAPTVDYSEGSILKLPYWNFGGERIAQLAQENIEYARTDWDSFESSWDFEEHPLVKLSKGLWDATAVGAAMKYYYNSHPEVSCPLELCYMLWQGECNERFICVKRNEEELNRIFIDLYGLQDDLVPEIEDKDITIRKAELNRDIRSLLSYAVGCMFGRYSLDEPGLVYAGGEWDGSKYSTFIPDKDNCIPITDEAYFEDDLVGQFVGWMKKAFGEENLEANLDFIAKALGNKGASSREVIRNYFLNDFMKDHIKIYQKRPIYWLFDSGKQNGFKALVYMHRWNADTVGNLRVEYLHKMQHTYEREIIRMQETIDNSRDSREVSKATKRKDKLQKQLKETKDYDAKLAHIALSRIEIDLDDGVKVNYEKVQTGRDGKKMQILAKI